MEEIIEHSGSEDQYPLPRNGRVLILNMKKDREGSENDVISIQKTFTSHSGFDIKVHENFTIMDIKDDNGMLRNFIKRLETEEVDALIIFVMAHGGSKSVLAAEDGFINFRKDILRLFSREESPLLFQIPKWFVVNACRGDQQLRPSWGKEFDNIPGVLKHSYCNTVILYSTLEGFVSIRHEIGTVLIQSLCAAINEYSRTYHLLDIFRKVSSELDKQENQLTELKVYGSYKNFCLTKSACNGNFPVLAEGSDLPLVYEPRSTGERDGSRSQSQIQIKDLVASRHIKFKRNNVLLLVRMLYKTKVETGVGKSTCYKFLFKDNSKTGSSEIEGVAFEEIGMILYKKLQVGGCVEIKEAIVKDKDWEFRNLGLTDNNLQLVFRNGHGVVNRTDLPYLPKFPLMKLTALCDVEHKHHRDVIDLFGKITHSSDVKNTERSNNYRTSILMDVTDDTEVPLTIWGHRPILKVGTVVFIRGVRVIKPAEIEEYDDDVLEDYEIRTEHNSIAQQSVIIEIQELDQVAKEYQTLAKKYLENGNQEETGSPKHKIRKTE